MISPAFLESNGFEGDAHKKLDEEYQKQEARRLAREAGDEESDDETEAQERPVKVQSPRKAGKAAREKEKSEREPARVLKLVQEAGEFVITWPFAYHAGFNLGVVGLLQLLVVCLDCFLPRVRPELRGIGQLCTRRMARDWTQGKVLQVRR